MIGINVMPPPPSPPRPPVRSSPGSPAAIAFSRAIVFSNDAFAIASMPKVENSFLRMPYGGRSPCSSSSTCGLISLSTNCRMASRIISCSSLHSIMERKLLGGLSECPPERVDLFLLAHDEVLEPVLHGFGARLLPGVRDDGVERREGLALVVDQLAQRVLGRRREGERGDVGGGRAADGDDLLDHAPRVVELGF